LNVDSAGRLLPAHHFFCNKQILIMSAFPPPAQALWREATAPDGRVYYYNPQTKATQWTKPAEMLSDSERALSQSQWKEYTHTDGRKYWHNPSTNETTWTMPDSVKQAQASAAPSLPSKPPAP
jgi:pre-mRNA-processing factor 40